MPQLPNLASSKGGSGGGGGLPTGGAAGQVVGYGGSSGTGAWVYPPGYELNYTAITATVNIVATSGVGTTIISPGAITFDGAPVLLQFFTTEVNLPTVAATVFFALAESGSQIFGLAELQPVTNLGGFPVNAHLRFTPTAGSHTYTITATTTSTTGTPSVVASSSQSAFARFTKV